MQTIAGHCYCGRGDRGLRQQLCCVGGRGVVQSGRKQNHQIESPAVNTMSVRLSASDRQFTLIAIFVHSTGPDRTSSIASQYPLVGISRLNVAGLLGQVRHASRCGHIPQLSSKSTLTEELGTTGLPQDCNLENAAGTSLYISLPVLCGFFEEIMRFFI